MASAFTGSELTGQVHCNLCETQLLHCGAALLTHYDEASAFNQTWHVHCTLCIWLPQTNGHLKWLLPLPEVRVQSWQSLHHRQEMVGFVLTVSTISGLWRSNDPRPSPNFSPRLWEKPESGLGSCAAKLIEWACIAVCAKHGFCISCSWWGFCL